MRGRGWGACIGFFIVLTDGYMIVSYIYPSLDLDGPEYFFPFLIFAVVGIGLSSIFGSIIGWVFGWVLEPSEPKNMDEPTKNKGVIMGRSVLGACIGFLVVLIGGNVIVFMIIQNGTLDEHTALIIFGGSLAVIPILSILGAIIGYFFGEKIYEFIDF